MVASFCALLGTSRATRASRASRATRAPLDSSRLACGGISMILFQEGKWLGDLPWHLGRCAAPANCTAIAPPSGLTAEALAEAALR